MPIDEQTIAELRARAKLCIAMGRGDVSFLAEDANALLTAASNEARLQREVEALRAALHAIAIHGHLVGSVLADIAKEALGVGNTDLLNAALTPPAAAEEDAP